MRRAWSWTDLIKIDIAAVHNCTAHCFAKFDRARARDVSSTGVERKAVGIRSRGDYPHDTKDEHQRCGDCRDESYIQRSNALKRCSRRHDVTSLMTFRSSPKYRGA